MLGSLEPFHIHLENREDHFSPTAFEGPVKMTKLIFHSS